MNKAGVIGAGSMGHGIAELLALHGYNVVLIDNNNDALERAKKKIDISLSKLSKKENFDYITFTNDLSLLRNASIIIEAVPENLAIKKQVLEDLSSIIKYDSIVASNTSTIPITILSSFIKNPKNFVGLHFFNPPLIMPLVEIIRGKNTSDDTIEKSRNLVKSIGKEEVTLKKEVPGFIVNRINARLFSETFRLIEEGFSKEQIDSASIYDLRFPMGMCQLLDFVGIDVVLYGARELRENGFEMEISPILERMVSENRLGIKSGKGFYDYNGKEGGKIHIKHIETGDLARRLISVGINEAYWLLKNDVADCDTIEKAMIKGMNWPNGPFSYAKSFGLEKIVEELEKEYTLEGKTWYKTNGDMVKTINSLCK